MTILFISRSKQNNNPSPIIQAQANSLKDLVNISFFTIKGKGWIAYIKAIFSLRRYLKSHNIDIIHAHYALSAYVAALSSSKPIVCSLMGSDVVDYRINRFFIKVFSKLCWKRLIVKSEYLKDKLGLPSAIVIPNGVDLELFKPKSKIVSREKMGFDPHKKIVLFLADPSRPEKNFQLAQKAIEKFSEEENVELKTVYNIKHHAVPDYITASDVVLLTSHFEGSPNVVKEAMACNIPVVSTNVGDVSDLFGDSSASYICDYTVEDVSSKISQALKYRNDFGETNGRDRIITLKMDQKSIAKKLFNVYNEIVAV